MKPKTAVIELGNKGYFFNLLLPLVFYQTAQNCRLLLPPCLCYVFFVLKLSNSKARDEAGRKQPEIRN